MRKFLIVMMAVAMTLGFAFTASAVNTVQVTLTSPVIVKLGCEKVGSVTFQFDAGSNLTVGDWWYMDLQVGVTICNQSINYMITGGNAGTFTYDAANAANTVFTTAGGGDSIADEPGAANGAVVPGSVGPITGTAIGAPPATSNVATKTVITGNMAILVQANLNDRRVLLTVLGDPGGGVQSLNVNTGYALNVKILDGQQWNNPAVSNHVIVLDSNSNNVYGDGGTATGDIITAAQPAADNTLCTDATQMSGNLMFTSFASLLDKFTFTGDSQIAHTGSASAITLVACKGATEGEILLGAQSTCNINYEPATGYCTTDAFGTQATPYGAVGGNKIIIQGSTTFGEAGDLWNLYIFSDTAGVYFSAAPGYLRGFTPTTTPGSCAVAAGAGGAVVAVAWTAVNEGGTVGAAYPAAGSCTIATANRVREIRSNNMTINTFNQLELDWPNLVYDTGVVSAGIEVDARIALRKYPCGQVASLTRTLGSFVSVCTPGAGATTLLVPFLPAWDGSQPGWWGGFLIVNTGTAAGTAALLFTDEEGDCATYTTPSLAANGGQWNSGQLSDLLTMVTDCTGNTGTFGDSNVNAVATCAFAPGGGFFFVGNSVEGVGSNAYVLQAAGWN